MAVREWRLSDLGKWLQMSSSGGGEGWWQRFRPPSQLVTSSTSWVRLTTACAAALLGTAFGTFWYIYQFRPQVLAQAIISWGRRQSGFASRTVKGSDGFVFSFGERGTRRRGQPIVILVPGLGGSIDNWVSVAKYMKDHYMIAVEMPGGGLTSCDLESDLTVLGQVERLRQLIQLLRLDDEQLHLGGAATGGTIVGCYAAIYPDNVAKLTLICPAIRSSETGDVVKMELAGVDSGMIFRSPETITKSFEVLSKKPRKLNKQIAKGIFEIKKHSLPQARKLADSMLEEIWKGQEDTLLVPRLTKIRAPTQVIWGQYDRIIHVSGVEVLKAGLKNCVSVDILPSGHSIHMDEPEKLAELLERFIARH